MNAIKFIQQHGVDKAREVVEGAPEWATHFDLNFKDFYQVDECEACCLEGLIVVSIPDLKRLVESITIVKDHGGLETIKKCVEKTIFPLSDRIIRMKQAIADYEQLFGNTETLGGEHV